MRTANSATYRIDIADGEGPAYRRIYRHVAADIEDGVLQAGEKLPSMRQLAADLGVSRPTVEQAYLQLAAEGYIVSQERSGYVVLPVDTAFFAQRKQRQARKMEPVVVPRARAEYFEEFKSQADVLYDFAYAQLEPGAFPRKQAALALSDIVRNGGDALFSSYPIETEPSRFQVAVARYLRRERGLACDPLQVVPFASTEQALQTVFQLFDENDLVGVEEPGFSEAVEVARRCRMRVAGVPSDMGASAYLGALRLAGPPLLFATPSHQFPTGKLMPLDMRVEVLKWANANDAFVVEDDSCHDYRYTTEPVPPLASLDTDERVIYLDNFSKTLSPGLRLAFAVLPRRLLPVYFERFSTTLSGVPQLVQELVAELLENGTYGAVVRRAVASNKAKNALLRRCLSDLLGDMVDFGGADSGIHVFATVNAGMDLQELIGAAADQAAKVYAADYCWFSRPAPRNKVIIGYSSIAKDLIEPGVAALARAWRA